MRIGDLARGAIDTRHLRPGQRGVVSPGAEPGVGDRATCRRATRRIRRRTRGGGDRAREREHVGVDWFTLDFNEELSAFHGAVARRQTEFAALAIERVLAAYPPSTPVIIAGHSMGGVVARAALLEIKGIAASVDATVVTIATPHEKSPAATQPAIARFYERTNRAWVDANNADVTSRVAMVSVGGGDADGQVRPARAKPPTAWTNGIGRRRKSFNVTHAVAGSIPGATGVSADHRCVVWCQQIVVPIAEALLDVASAERQNDAGGRVARADATRTRRRRRAKPKNQNQNQNQKPGPGSTPPPRSRSIGPLPSSRSCSRWRSTRSSCRRRRGAAGSAWREPP